MERLPYEDIIESAPDAMVIIDFEGHIIKVNHQFELLFGYSKDQIIGQKVETLLPNKFQKLHPVHRGNYFSNPHTRPMGSGLQLFGKRKDDSEFPIEISLSPIDDGKFAYAAIRDVTERQLMTDYLISQNKKLQDFAHIISHNLRSPVANFSSLIALYKLETVEDEKTKIMDMLENTANKLKDTLNDLLDVLMIKHDTMKSKKTIYFKEVFDKVLTFFEVMIQQKNATVTADFSQLSSIEYSPIYLESILQNLLSNALKYSSPKRNPVIHFTTRTDGKKQELLVTDNGLGINIKRNEKDIFGLHKTFHKNLDAKGVGLFITKSQVEAMGGMIKVDSEEDKGSTFTIVFNLMR